MGNDNIFLRNKSRVSITVIKIAEQLGNRHLDEESYKVLVKVIIALFVHQILFHLKELPMIPWLFCLKHTATYFVPSPIIYS